MLGLMTAAAEILAQRGWILRSGHAPGADQAFEAGAGSQAEVYLPWPGFERSVPLVAQTVVERPHPAAFELATEHHPGWEYLPRGARALHARNAHQVLGADLRTPVSFVLCWTSDGSLDGRGADTGGTGQALRMAAARGVTVYNLCRADHAQRVTQGLSLVLPGQKALPFPRALGPQSMRWCGCSNIFKGLPCVLDPVAPLFLP